MRAKRAILNFITSFSRTILATLLSLATTPLILNSLGDERFGAYRLLLDWLSHLGTLEFGLYSASLALLSKASTEDDESIRGTLKLIFKNYGYVFLAQVGFFILFFYFVDRLIPVSLQLQNELRISALIMSISLIFIVSQIFKAYLEATQKGYLVSITLVLFNIAFLVQCSIFAYWRWGLWGQVIAYVSSLFLSFCALVYLAPEVISSLLSKKKSKTPSQLLQKQRFSHFVNELCGRISLMSDNIIISFFLGAGPVTAFFITQKVGNMMQQQLQHLSNSSWAALSELHYQGKHEQFNRRVLNLTELIAFSSGVILSVVCLLNYSFISLWTGAHTYSGEAVTNLTAINAAFFSILSLWSWCFAATNLTQKIVIMSIVQGVVNISASIYLTKKLGVTGPLYGTLIGYCGVVLFWKSAVLCKVFGIDFLKLTFSWLKPLAPPLIITFAYLRNYGTPFVDSWLKLFITAFICTSIITIICFATLLSAENRMLLKNIIFSKKNYFFKK